LKLRCGKLDADIPFLLHKNMKKYKTHAIFTLI